MSYGFQGDIAPKEVWVALQNNENSQILDVRTAAEWRFVGQPDLSAVGRNVVGVSWQLYPGMTENAAFLEQVEQAGFLREHPIYILCRSGVRSLKAAQLLGDHGYLTFNIANGFEGALDGKGHRGGVSGWQADGLPWRQG